MPRTILNEFITMLSMSPEYTARIHEHIQKGAPFDPFDPEKEVLRANLAFNVQLEQVTPVWLDLVPELKGSSTDPAYVPTLYDMAHALLVEAGAAGLDSESSEIPGLMVHRSPSASTDYESWIAKLSGEIQEDALFRAIRRADVKKDFVDLKTFETAAEISWMAAAIALHRMEPDAKVLPNGYRNFQRIPELRQHSMRTWQILEEFVKAAVEI